MGVYRVETWLIGTGAVLGVAFLVLAYLYGLRPMLRAPGSSSPQRAHPPLPPAVDPQTPLSTRLVAWAEWLGAFPQLKETVRRLLDLAADLERPLTVLVTGRPKAGKSTLINTLLGEDVLPVDVAPPAPLVIVIRYGDKERARVVDGSGARTLPLKALPKLLAGFAGSRAVPRGSVRAIEIELPLPILRVLTVVEAPALPGQSPLDAEITREWAKRADLALWVLAYADASSAGDDEAIHSLVDGGVRTIVVVNRADEHAPGDGPLADVLAQAQRSLGRSVDAVIGVSAHWAWEAMETGDAALWAESGWPGAEGLLTAAVRESGERLKNQEAQRRLEEVWSHAWSELVPHVRSYQEAYELTRDREPQGVEPATLLSRIEQCQSLLQSLESGKAGGRDGAAQAKSKHGQRVEEVLRQGKPPRFVRDYDQLAAEWTRLQTSHEQLTSERSRLAATQQVLNSRITAHQHDVDELKKAWQEWSKSGLLGGKPIVESLVGGGRRAALEARSRELDQEAAVLKRESAQLNEKIKEWQGRLSRADHEAEAYVARLKKALRETMKELQGELRGADRERREAGARLHELNWVPVVYRFLSQRSPVDGLIGPEAAATLDAASLDLVMPAASRSVPAGDLPLLRQLVTARGSRPRLRPQVVLGVCLVLALLALSPLLLLLDR